MSVSLQLKKFDITRIRDDKVVVLIGKRKSGKTFIVKNILYQNRNTPVGTIISPTESANKFFSNMVPSLFIHDEYTPELIANVMKRQKMVTKRYNSGETDIDRRAFLIMDDCLYDNAWKKDKNIRSIFMNGRHYKMLFILTMQYSLGIGPSLRGQCDFIFILRENIISNRKRLYDHYAGFFPSFEAFSLTLDQCTENYECLVIDNTTRSNKLEDQVFWYKADDLDDFKVGADIFWKHHQNNYNEDDFDDDKEEEDDYEDDIDINEYYNNKRKGPNINIKKI